MTNSAQGEPALGWQFLSLFYLFSIASALIIIFVYDLKYYLIPDSIVYSAIAMAGIYQVLSVLKFGPPAGGLGNLENALASSILASAFFLAIYLVSRGRWMGFGDVKLAFFMGLFLGFPKIIAALFLAFFMGAFVGIILIVAKKKHLRSEVPFGPFLIVGTCIALFWGQDIMDWYLQFLVV